LAAPGSLTEPPAGEPVTSKSRRRRWVLLGLGVLAAVAAAYLLIAYLVLPLLWREHEARHHPALDAAPTVTTNADGIPGDPINVALVGSRTELVGAMLAAGWHPADPITFKTSIEIAESVVLDRPDPDAPVSPLYLFGRKQDLAFERDVGSSADRRHHVRWWKSDRPDAQGRPLWLGDATFDADSGLSHLTGQITHHIAPDIDAERDALIAGLAKAGQLDGQYEWPGVGATRDGRNAEGDRYETDGFMLVGVLRSTDGGG
jgi:LssY C-terminus